ncbi:MAG TPA: ArsB/NhaD family transporter, partial [Ktedonobacterales bacterium]|nr:ArsB/NhaD family transporter [Ktedonobacterales bacterium]
PTLAAFVVAGGAFALRFRARLNTRFDVAAVGDPDAAIRDRFVFWAGWVALGALVVGYAIVGALGLPVALVAGVVALGMLALVRARRLRTVREAVTAAPWSVLIYAIGMFVVITAAYRAGALAIVVDLLRAGVATSSGAPGAIGAGALAAALAAAVNNLPAALIGVLSLRAVGGIGAASHVAIYAIMLGVDIGPKLTPFGSLATLLWLGILERHGQHISWGLYLRENWWVTLLTLTAALAALLIPYAIFG